MKHIFCLLLVALPHICNAQDVFDAVMSSAQTVMANPDADDATLAIAQFKLTQLRYLNRKAVESQMTVRQMDVQAYYLSEFLSAYTRMLTMMHAAPKKELKAEVLKFVKASAENPLFKDNDKDTILAFVDDDTSLTPFSLDTDWQKAYEQMFPAKSK